MIRPAARPRLTCWSTEPPEIMVKRFHEALAAESHVTGQALPGFVNLWPPDRDRSFFSPYLSLEVRPQGEGSVATGRFGPHPAVWTGFVFVYAVLGFVGVLALMIGWAQSIADEPPSALLGAPASIALILFIYGAEYIGKGMGSEQMHDIAHFVQRVVPVTQFPAPIGQEASPPPPDEGGPAPG